MEKKGRIILITLMLITLSIPVMIASGQTSNSQLLDNIEVSSNGSHVSSNIALQNGVSYQIVVSGTYFTVSGDLTQNNQQDAMYETHDKWMTQDTALNGLYVDSWSIGSKQWGPYNSDHNYQCSLVGNGSKVSFWIYSSTYNGNSGSLSVQILGSPVAPPSPTPTQTSTTSPTPTISAAQTPSASPTPLSTSPQPSQSPTSTNSHTTTPTPSSTSPIITNSPNQTSGLQIEGPVTIGIALIVSIIVVALVLYLLSKKNKLA
jgi:hypothetical protein